MDIYRILENFNAASREPLNEGPIGAIAGGLAGAALTRSPGGAMAGASMGDSLTDEARDPSVWDAQAIAQKKAKLAREKNAMMMQRKISGQDSGLPPGVPVAPKPMGEMVDEALHHICETHRAACEHFVKGGDLDSELFDALHNHYLSRGEMPFGIAKMRDGHPKDWCAQKLAEHLGLEECGTGWPLGAGEVAPMAESTNSIRKLAGLAESADDVEEGNDFTQARKDAIAAGKTSFKCGGKIYKVTGDTSDEKKQVKEGSKPDFLDMDKDGNKKEPMKKAVADKKAGPEKGVNPFAKKDKKVDESKEDKPAFPGSPEYEKKYGKVKHDDDSAFHKTKVSTGTVYSRKHKEEPEVDDEDDTPKKKGRPAGTKKKIGAKGPSTTSKLIKDGPKKAPSKAKKKVKEAVDLSEGIMDAVKRTFNDNVAGWPMGTSREQFIQGWAEDIKDETGRDIPLEKLGQLYDDYCDRADQIMQSHGTTNEDMDIEDQGEYDEEGSMVKDNIHTIRRAIDELENCISDNDNMPEWVEEKISQAKGMSQAASEYIQTQQERGSEEEIDEVAPVAAPAPTTRSSFKKGDKVIANGAPAIVYNIDAANNIAYVQYEADIAKGSPQTAATVLNQLKPAAPAASSSFKKGDKVIANGEPATVYNIDAANNTAYVQYDETLAKGSPQTAAVVLNQLKPAGVSEAGYSAKAARAGKDIGKPGKNFAKIAKSSGGGEKGQRIAGAVLNKLRHPTDEDTIEERSVSQAQQRTMGAAAHNPKFAKKVGIKPGVAKEFNRADTGHKMSELPQRVKETGMGGTVAGGMAPAPGAKTFAEASSGSHEAAWKAAGKAVHAIMKKRGYTGSKTEEGYMWTKQTPRGTAFIDIDFDERDPETARWGEGELKGAKNKSYWQSGNDNISDLAQVIGQLFANVKDGQPAMDEADEDGKPNFAKKDSKHKPDDDGDGVPDWADKKPGKDDNEESDDSEESDEEDDDKVLKKMKSHAGIEDKDDDSDKEESDDKPKKGKKPDFGKKKDDDSDDEDDSDDSDDEESDDKDDSEEKSEKKDSGDSEEKSKDKSGTPYGKSVYESAFKKSLKTQLRESVNMNTSQDDTGKKSVTVTATDEDADKLSELLKMAGLFSSQGYSSVCQGCGGVHEAGACGAGIEVAVDEAYGDIDVETNRDLANSPDENYSDENTMINTLSGGLNGRKSTGQSTGPVVNRQDSRQGIMGEAQKVQEEAKNRLWKLYGDMSSK